MPDFFDDLERLLDKFPARQTQEAEIVQSVIIETGILVRNARIAQGYSWKTLSEITEIPPDRIYGIEFGNANPCATWREVTELLFACGYKVKPGLVHVSPEAPALKVVENEPDGP